MGAAAIGTTISVYAIARLMMNLPAGILADRYGRKPLLVWGPLITALGELCHCHCNSALQLHQTSTDRVIPRAAWPLLLRRVLKGTLRTPHQEPLADDSLNHWEVTRTSQTHAQAQAWLAAWCVVRGAWLRGAKRMVGCVQA